MSEPTKEAIEEARAFILRTQDYPGISFATCNLSEVAQVIAHVRKQARDNALEVAAIKCESFDDLHPEAAFHRVAIAIRALKTQGDTKCTLKSS